MKPLISRSAISLAAWMIALISHAAIAQWPQLARDAAHTALAPTAPRAIDALLWLRAENPPGSSIAYVGPSAPALLDDRVFACARRLSGSTHINNKIVALDRAAGSVLFETTIDKSVLDSWSSPAADATTNAVFIGSGNKLFCIDALSGAITWSRPLARSIVNASPLVVEHPSRGRVLITDYDGFGSAASLYALNSSPFHPTENPYAPGDIVWREPIGGSSGNTPASSDGTIFVATSRGLADSSGHILAFDLDAPDGARLLWNWTLPAAEGFFGGLTVQSGFIYAATYDPNGTGDNSTLVKLRAADGALQWTVPCERSASIPLIRDDLIYLSAGIQGFGSASRLQCFQDLSASAQKRWDTYTDSAGALVLGGWNHHPVLGDDTLLIGKIPTSTGNFFGPCTDLYILDPTLTPSQPGFIRDHRSGLGSSPAIADGRVFTIGTSGLACLATRGDSHPDGRLDARDIQPFINALLSSTPSQSEIALGDFSQNNQLDLADADALVQSLLNQ